MRVFLRVPVVVPLVAVRGFAKRATVFVDEILLTK